MGERRRRVVLRGTLVALERDERARVQQVLLITDDDLEFLVENNAIGRYLAECIDSEVEVHGIVDERDDGQWTIRPQSFREVGFDEVVTSDWVQTWRARTV